MKTRLPSLFAILLSGTVLLNAQTPAPEPPAETKPSAPASDSQALDYLYNRSGSQDSAAGTVADDYRQGKVEAKGKQSALESMVASQSLLSPAFEKFLSAAEANKDQLAEYQKLYRKALDLLAERKPGEAWPILGELSTFEWDAGISRQIANRVRAIWDTNGTAKSLLVQNDKLQEQIKTSNWNADLQATRNRLESEDRATTRTGSPTTQAAKTATDTAAGPGALRMTEEYFKSLDSKARIKLNEVRVENIKSKARADLLAYITTLYKSHRYLHVVLASEFYQALFVDGELPPEVANQATASLEATRDIANAVEVFRFKAEQKQITSASTILEEAWKTGDSTPEMLGLPRATKMIVVDHANRVRKMRNLIEARNFDALEKLLDEMEETASDFDTVKPRALVQAIKLDSRMKLGQARLYAQQGDTAKALAEFKASAEIWPGNPDLEKSSAEYFKAEDLTAKATGNFDRDFSEKSYRKIAENQVAYLALVQSDAKRKGQFRTALEAVQKAETAIEKSKMQEAAGDPAGAWETVEMAAVSWPEDSRVNQYRADYASKAPDFVGAIRKAQTAEKNSEIGSSLSLFALARNRYPASTMASDGLKRVSGKFVNPEKGKPESSPSPVEKKESATSEPDQS